MKSYACGAVRQKAMLDATFDKKLYLELRWIISYACRGVVQKAMLGEA